MSVKVATLQLSAALTASLLLPLNAGVLAQEEASEESSAADEVIEEIVVIGGDKPGDPVDVEALYEEQLRESLLEDLERLRVLEEQNEWRNMGTTDVERPSRISWGYSPQDELRIRRNSDIHDANWETTRPASVIRVDF